jgi:hypothetical protein
LWAAERDDCISIDQVEPYERARVAGVVERLRIDPRAGVIEADITDGVASIGAQWPILRPVPQLRAAPGWGLILDGIAHIDVHGDLRLVEPDFQVVPGPNHG